MKEYQKKLHEAMSNDKLPGFSHRRKRSIILCAWCSQHKKIMRRIEKDISRQMQDGTIKNVGEKIVYFKCSDCDEKDQECEQK